MNFNALLDFSVQYVNILVASFLILIFVYTVFISKSENKQERVLGILSLLVAIWTVDLYFVDRRLGYEISLFFNKLSFVLPLFVLTLIMILFVLVLRKNTQLVHEKIIFWMSLLINLGLSAFIFFSNLVVTEIVWSGTFYNVLKGPGYDIYLVLIGGQALFFLFYFLATTLFNVWPQNVEVVNRVKARYLGIITSISIGLVFFTNIILPIITGSSKYSQLVPLVLVLWCVGVLILISRFRLFDLGFMVRWVFFVVMGASVLTGILYLVFLILRQVEGTFAIIVFLAIVSITGIIVSIILQTQTTALIDYILYLGKENPIKSAINLSNEIATLLNPQDVAEKLGAKVSGLVGVNELAIVIFDSGKKIKSIEPTFSYIKNLSIDTQGVNQFLVTIEYWKTQKQEEILIDYEIKEKLELSRDDDTKKLLYEIYKLMNKNNVSVILPLNRKVQLHGIVMLGRRENNVPYMSKDIKVFEELIKISSVAFGRSLLYQEVQEFSKTLQKKVDAATIEIRDKMEKMQEMRRRERDMLDIMGHELRTPLTIIKNAASMIDYYEAQKMIKLDPTLKEQFVNIKEALNREINLVETMLAATKIDANKIELNLDYVDLGEIIRQTKLAFSHVAKEKGLKLTFDYDKRKNWTVVADKFRIQEVLDNLVSNAVKYTMEGSVTVRLNEKDYSIESSVEDTGVGISASDIKNLGKKFFRANPYANKDRKKRTDVVRPGGTGLGLYVTFGLIKAMGGRIRIESTLGKGSKFTFTLPKGK